MQQRSHSSLRWLRGALVAVAAACTWRTANAAAYTAIWDPEYGAGVPGMGWAGRAEFDVPDTCIPGSGSGYQIVLDTILSPSCGNQARVTSAEVDLYRLSDNSPLSTLSFTSSWLFLNVLALQFDDGALEQAVTTPSQLASAGFTDAGMGVSNRTYFQLVFTLEGPRLLEWYCRFYCSYQSINDNENFRPDFIISRVPEPATLALVGIALAAAASGGMRRRRTAMV
jgi:hypothetical protein